MDRNSDDYTSNKLKFIAIGAGALVLALIVFSSFSWCAIVACGRRLAGIPVGFWELFGGASLAVLAVLFIRPLRNRVLPRQLRSGPLGESVKEPAAEAEEIDTSTMAGERKQNWRTLYDQLSHDERQMFKSMMKKYCDDISDAASPSDARTSPESN